MSKESYTWQEIVIQPETWRGTLKHLGETGSGPGEFIPRLAGKQIIFIGCGSTHYLAQSASACLSHVTGISSCALPSSEVWLYPESIQPEKSALIAVSRSGTTTETLLATRKFREAGGGPIVAITCYPESGLAKAADFVLEAVPGQERSIAQTRSFTSMLLLCQALIAAFMGKATESTRLGALPDALERLTQRMGEIPARVGRDLSIHQMVFLGGGPLFGLASEAMLKTMEMSLTDASAFHPREFRHGPMSLTGGETLVIGLLSDRGARCETDVLADLQGLGARTLVVAEDASRLGGLKPDYLIELRSGLEDWERLPLFLPPLQHLAFHRAVAKGLDPDRPRNLRAVIELQGVGDTSG
jgi:glucosamine--fructose-6-phosphate aminotransferase (isomerizing)